MNKKTLLLLHDAIASKRQFGQLIEKLNKKYDVHAVDFPGHGKLSLTEEPLSIDLFAEYLIEWMDKKKIEKVHLFGYGIGGFTAIYLAYHYPERVNRVFTLATKFNWSREVVHREVKLLDLETIEQKLPDFVKELRKQHGVNTWKTVVSKTIELFVGMGKKNPLTDEKLREIEHHVLIGMGDRDNTVHIEESVYSFRLLKNSSLLIIPETPRPFDKVPTRRLVNEIKSFFD